MGCRNVACLVQPVRRGVVAPAAALIVIAWSGKLGWPPLLGLIVAVAAGLGIISDRIRKP